jgi:hypothetical protein
MGFFSSPKPKQKAITREIRDAKKAADHAPLLSEYEKLCKAFDGAKDLGKRAEIKLRALEIERELGRKKVKFDKHAALHRK